MIQKHPDMQCIFSIFNFDTIFLASTPHESADIANHNKHKLKNSALGVQRLFSPGLLGAGVL